VSQSTGGLSCPRAARTQYRFQHLSLFVSHFPTARHSSPQSRLELLQIRRILASKIFVRWFLEVHPTEVCTGAARTKEQLQRRVRSLAPRMVLKEQPTDLEGQARAQLIVTGRNRLRRDAEYILGRLGPAQNLPCASAAVYCRNNFHQKCNIVHRSYNSGLHLVDRYNNHFGFWIA
jgi:hypothetical protein